MIKLIKHVINKNNLSIIPPFEENLILIQNSNDLKINETYIIGILMIGVVKNNFIQWKKFTFEKHHYINKHIYDNHIVLKLLYKQCSTD